MKPMSFLAAVAALIAVPVFAYAHATLETREAPVASTYKAVLRVPHGCGHSATTSIRIQIPDGVIAVKPMPKPGWQLSTVTGDYAKPYAYYDETLTKGVKEIAWTGGKLLDEHYDEFVFRAFLPAGPAGSTVYFPVVQACEQGVNRWIEIPAAGQSADDLKEPAPGVKLVPKAP